MVGITDSLSLILLSSRDHDSVMGLRRYSWPSSPRSDLVLLLQVSLHVTGRFAYAAENTE